jgi:hypothetical protein
MSMADAIAYIARVATPDDTAAACIDLIAAIRDGKIAFRRQNGEEVRREALQLGMVMPDGTLLWVDEYYTTVLADGRAMPRRYVYSDLEVLRSDVEALWRRGEPVSDGAVMALSSGPKGGETKAAPIAWEIVKPILADEAKRPPRGRGRLTALARAVQAALEARGHNRELNTVTKYIRPSLRDWEAKNPDK